MLRRRRRLLSGDEPSSPDVHFVCRIITLKVIMSTLTRREIVKLTAGMAIASLLIPPQQTFADDRWFDINSDEGSPVNNSQLPGELTGELANLPGVIWVGSSDEVLTLYEFYDDNCPYCRQAVKDVHRIVQTIPDLRLGLINNAVLSPLSMQSAKVGLALLKLKGSAVAYQLHQRLLGTVGAANGERALQFGIELGVDRAQLEREAASAEIKTMLVRQMRAAANLGLTTTPAFVLGNTAISGYPGPKTLVKIIDAGRSCGEPVC